ncbi:MAG: VOC family protein [Gammaproteobacteria bacterium]|jgi:glyoxylase I family protein
MKILGLDHVVVRANDIEKMVAFYRDVLGCPVERSLEDLGLWQLRAGSALIDLVDVKASLGRQGGPGPGPEGHNMDHFCLRIDDFDEAALRAHLERFGVEAGETGQRYGADGTGPSIYIRDPEGNTVELKGPPTS